MESTLNEVHELKVAMPQVIFTPRVESVRQAEFTRQSKVWVLLFAETGTLVATRKENDLGFIPDIIPAWWINSDDCDAMQALKHDCDRVTVQGWLLKDQ